MKNLVHGVVPPMITVFEENGSINEKGMREHIRFMMDGGVHGVSPGGSTGEMIAMTIEERKELTELVVDECAGKVAVYPGTMHYSTSRTIELSRHAEKAGADGLLIILPYYLNPPKHDAIDYFRDIRQAVGLPIILYNNIWFSGYEFDPWEIASLVDEGVLQGVKCAHGDPWKVHTLKQICGDKLVIYYGHDINGLEALLCGADGWLSGSINLIPELCVELFDATRKGDLKKSWALWTRMTPLMNFVCVNRQDNYPHFIQVFKDGLNMIGNTAGVPQKPLTPLKDPSRNFALYGSSPASAFFVTVLRIDQADCHCAYFWEP